MKQPIALLMIFSIATLLLGDFAYRSSLRLPHSNLKALFVTYASILWGVGAGMTFMSLYLLSQLKVL